MESIVAGTDGSPCATTAVEWAAHEAERRRRALHIVHAAEHRGSGIPFHPAVGSLGSLTEIGERILAEAAVRAAKECPELRITTEVIFEAPVYALRARAEHAYEVVVGHRGLGGFSALLLGSTSLRIAGHTPCPVVVVRGETDESRGEVLVGVDLSEESAIVLEHAFEAAAIRGAWVRAVHAWPVPSTVYADADPVTVRRATAEVQRLLGQMVEPWRERFPDVKVIEQPLPGHPVERLAESSRRADLLVVGSAGHDSRCFGSVVHGVIHHADCPITVVGHRSP
ncbi:universal stress protein [Actinoallomurus sp. NPDC050550]|uniref:universal stress protein n=1 Tax=Actinoallomurus sp. NPDC050550 TaxID=3154937 RepID=UPI0033DD6302